MNKELKRFKQAVASSHNKKDVLLIQMPEGSQDENTKPVQVYQSFRDAPVSVNVLRGLMAVGVVLVVVALSLDRWFRTNTGGVGLLSGSCAEDQRRCDALRQIIFFIFVLLIILAILLMLLIRRSVLWLVTASVKVVLIAVVFVLLFDARDRLGSSGKLDATSTRLALAAFALDVISTTLLLVQD